MDERLEAVRRRKRVVLLLVFLGIIAALIFLLRAVLAPFLVALFAAYLIDPLVGRMAMLRLPRGLHLGRAGSVVIIYLVLIFCFYLGAKFTVPALGSQIEQVREDLPKAQAWMETIAQHVVDWYTKRFGEEKVPAEEEGGKEPGDEPPPSGRYRVRFVGGGEMTGVVVGQTENEVVIRMGPRFVTLKTGDIEQMDAIDREDARFNLAKLLSQNIQEITGQVKSALGLAINLGLAVLKALYGSVIILMITAFISIDRHRIVSFIHSVPPDRHRQTWLRLADYLDKGLAGVIRGQLTICVVNGLLTWIGLQLLGVRYSALLGLVAGVASIIPIFGTIMSSVLIVPVAWAYSGIDHAVLTLGWILLIHFLEANFLNPKIMGSASKIHPVVIIFALIAGENAYGVAGALLAVPAASILQSCFKFFVVDRQLESAEEAA